MANVYYGDGGHSTVTGNWNTVSNWFSSLSSGCCFCHPGTPLGRVPNASTDSVNLTSSSGNAQVDLTVGPTGGYSGSVTILVGQNLNPFYTNFNIASGIFSGQWNVGNAIINAINTIESGVVINPGGIVISGGTFSGLFNFAVTNPSFPTLELNAFNHITAQGEFCGVQVTGGTYSPIVNMTLNRNFTLNPINFVSDPGFASFGGGGIFAPIINLSGFPDILGAGLPS
jgi:hypothetical protein